MIEIKGVKSKLENETKYYIQTVDCKWCFSLHLNELSEFVYFISCKAGGARNLPTGGLEIPTGGGLKWLKNAVFVHRFAKFPTTGNTSRLFFYSARYFTPRAGNLHVVVKIISALLRRASTVN